MKILYRLHFAAHGRKWISKGNTTSIIVEFPFERLVNEMCDRQLTLISSATQFQSHFRQIIHLCQIFVGDKPFIAAREASDGVVFFWQLRFNSNGLQPIDK